MANATTDRVHHTIRWVTPLYERVEALAEDLGISKNDAFNVLVREALDARERARTGALVGH